MGIIKPCGQFEWFGMILKYVFKTYVCEQVLLASPSVIQAAFLLSWPWILQMSVHTTYKLFTFWSGQSA